MNKKEKVQTNKEEGTEQEVKEKQNLVTPKIEPVKVGEVINFLKKEIRRNWLILTALVILCLGALIYNYKSLFVAATVNGKPIFRWEVIRILETQMGKQALTNIIDEKLIDDEAALKNIVVSNDEVQARVKTIEDSIVQSGQTMDQFLEANNSTRKDFEIRVKNLIVIEKLLSERVAVSEEEVTKYIADNKASFPEITDDEQGRSIVRESLKQQKLATEYTKYLTELKSRSSVNILVNY